MKKEPEDLIAVYVTPNEVIAMNVAINHFLRYCKHTSPVYETASTLLIELQRRVRDQLPGQQFPSDVKH